MLEPDSKDTAGLGLAIAYRGRSGRRWGEAQRVLDDAEDNTGGQRDKRVGQRVAAADTGCAKPIEFILTGR